VGITNILILDLLTYAEKLLDVFGWMEGKEREKKTRKSRNKFGLKINANYYSLRSFV
jgi:hypothetical protein